MNRFLNSFQKFFKSPEHGRFAGPLDYLSGRNYDDNDWKLPLILAVGVHLLTFIAAFSTPILFQRTPRIPEVYTVNLYTAPEMTKPAPAPQIKAPPPVKADKTVVPKIVKPAKLPKPKAVSLKPLKQKLQKEKEKKEKELKEQMLANQLELLKNKIKQQEAEKDAKDAAKDAIDKLADLYRSQQNAKTALQELVKPAPAIESTGPAGEYDNNIRVEALARYKAQLFHHIHQHWTLPDLQSWEDSLEAVIVVLVKRDGTVINSYFDKRSDDINFNREVEKAIRLSSPLPPFPPELPKDEEELVITFFPGGML